MMTVNGSYQAVSQDVSDTVKAWLSQAKRRISDPSVKPQEILIMSKGVTSSIADVLTLRSMLSRDNIANRDLQDCSRAMASKLDSVSRLLNLDCVFRDPEDGTVLVPHNQLPNIVISKQREVYQESAVVPSSKHAGSQPLYAVLDVLSARLPVELLPSTITARLHFQFYIFMPTQSSEVKISESGIAGTGERTEPFSVVWDRSSVADQSWQPKQSAIFDLSSFHWPGTPVSNRIYLICVAYRIGTMKSAVLSEESSSKLASSSEQQTPNIKRPMGMVVLDLFPATPVRAETRLHSLRKIRRPSHPSFVDASTYDEPTNLLSWQDPNGASYTLNFASNAVTLQELASEAIPLPNTLGAPLNNCQIDVKLTLLTSAPIVCTNAALINTKAAPLYLEPCGFLNPKINLGLMSRFYVTLLDGMLSRLGSSRKTNAEISVYAIKVLQTGSGTTKSDIQPVFCSTVHDATDKPVWYEHFEVEVDDDSDASLHLLFSIRMRSSRLESDKKSERERFFAYLPLTYRCDDCLVAIEDKPSISLAIYRLTHHAKDPSTLPSPSSYLSLEWRFEEISRRYLANSMAQSSSSSSPAEHIMSSQKSNSSLGNVLSAAWSPIYSGGPAKTISVGDGVDFCARNFLNLEVTFCSAQMAQSEKLAQFLALRARNVGESINQKATQLAGVFMELDTELWIHLLFPCFDKIFELIAFAGKTQNQDLLDVVFTRSLLSILKTLLRSKAQDGRSGTLPQKYIATTFCSPTCFIPLADALNRCLANKTAVLNPVEVIVICTKFAISSYRQYVQLCAQLQISVPDNILPDFAVKLKDIVRKLMELSVRDPILRQKCLPDVIGLVSGDFCDRSALYQGTIVSAANWSDKEVLDFYRVLANRGHLGSTEGRRILLPPILAKCCQVLDAFSFERPNVNSFSPEFQVAYLALMVLQEVLNANVGTSTSQLLPVLRFSLRVACLVSPSNDSHWLAMNIALSCGKLLNFDSLECYFSSEAYAHPLEVVDFINECLFSIEKLFAIDPELKQLASFIYLRNSVIANNVLAEFGRFVIRKLGQMGSIHVIHCLRQFLHTTLTFLLQPALEVERFPEKFQSQRFAAHLGDLRLTAARVLLDFWNDLAKSYKILCSKVLFQSDASLVQLALSCLPELRHCACLILKDILRLEFEMAYSQKRRSTQMNQVLETQGCIALFLQGLDYLVIKWPQRTREFHEDFQKVFEQKSPSSEIDFLERQVDLLLETVKNQLILLEDYIAACTRSPSPVAELTCLRRMILFYHKKDLIVPYVTHLSTLYQRQLGRQMFAEAGAALEELSNLVSWTDEPLPTVLQNLSLVHHAGTQRSFKEALYEKAAELFQETKLYERAVILYRELMKQHLNYTFDYEKLAQVHECLAALTRMIATSLRQPPRFFWVTFVGAHSSILPCLQNTSFIFRAPSHQMVSDFAHLFKCWFPEVAIRHEPPPLVVLTALPITPAIHILTVEPDSHDMVSRKFPFRVPERIVSYYRVNDILRFIHVRTKKHTDGSVKGECFDLDCAYSMPYMLEWADVRLEKVQRRQLDAVQLAFYDVNKKNVELRAYLDAYQSTRNDANNKQQDLQRGVKGIVDAPIGGGIFMYVPFFASDYNASDNQTALRQLHEAILIQHHLATEGMKYLKKVMCVNVPDLRGLYEFMEVQYGKYNQVVADIRSWQSVADSSRRVTTHNISVPQPVPATPSSDQNQQKRQTSIEPDSLSMPRVVSAEVVSELRKSADGGVRETEQVYFTANSDTPRPKSSSTPSLDNLSATITTTTTTPSTAPSLLPEGISPQNKAPPPARPPPPVPPKRKNIVVLSRPEANEK